MLIKQQAYYSLKPDIQPVLISFHFMFASIIAPFISTNINLLFQTNTWIRKKNLLKNSYVILAWFYYLNSVETLREKPGIRFFVLPTRAQVYTLTKAPLAHKLWSKEQYKFVFYLLRVSFTNNRFIENEITTVNQGLFFLLLVKKSFPFFSSNLMVLKTYRVSFTFIDNQYFAYF